MRVQPGQRPLAAQADRLGDPLRAKRPARAQQRPGDQPRPAERLGRRDQRGEQGREQLSVALAEGFGEPQLNAG